MSEKNSRIEAERDLAALEAVLFVAKRGGDHEHPSIVELERRCRELRRLLDLWAGIDTQPVEGLN